MRLQEYALISFEIPHGMGKPVSSLLSFINVPRFSMMEIIPYFLIDSNPHNRKEFFRLISL